MRSAHWLAVLALLVPLSACITIQVPQVTPGNYPNYREMLVAQLDLLPFSAPKDLVHELGVCGADVLVDNLTHSELQRLDQYARGELKMSESEIKGLDSEVRNRIGGEDGLERAMRDRCPEAVKEAEAYKKAHS